MGDKIGSIRDIIDLEYFLQRDEHTRNGSDRADLVERDRQIYLQRIRPLEASKGSLPPGRVLSLWLDERRKSHEASRTGTSASLPGEVFAELYRWMVYGFLIAGILSGGGLAFSLLNYGGSAPLNVSVYMAALVLSQCLALLLLMGVRFIRRLRRSPFRGSVIFTLVSGLMTRLFIRMREGALKRLDGSTLGGIEAAAGLIRGRRQVYGTVFYWPVFILLQICGIGFNIGALTATLLKVVGADVAFGWQSTIQFSEHAVYQIVRIISLPWSWWAPAHLAHPSLSEIKGSHLVLKDGIYHLATQDLVSWWPFLFLAVVTYGLAPRIIILATGLLLQRRAISRVDLGHAACADLLHRLTTPLVTTQGRVSQAAEATTAEQEARVPGIDAGITDLGHGSRWEPVSVLVPDDIFEACGEEELAQVVRKVIGRPVRERLRFGDPTQDAEVFHRVADMGRGDGAPGLLIVQEAWQPPIREVLRFIQEVRRAAGEKTVIRVGLIGRPRDEKVFTPPRPEDEQVWQHRLQALGDPYLRVERLAHEP